MSPLAVLRSRPFWRLRCALGPRCLGEAPGWLPSTLVAIALWLTPNPACASTMLDVEVAPGFDPRAAQRSGISTGPISVQSMFRPSAALPAHCLGYVNRFPNHIIQLEDDFQYLQLSIRSRQDTTVVVQGPNGIWCNDDSDGHNPVLAGEWAAGTYAVWVGTYRSGLLAPYTLHLSQ